MKPAWLRPGKMTFLYRFVLFLAWVFYKVLYRHRVYGLEHFYEGSGIIASNHASYYDPPIVAISWPEEVQFLAKQELFINPLFGWFIRSLNAHPVSGDVGDVSIFKEIISLLKEGKKVLLFPEGSRATEDVLAPIKPGIALLVSRSQSAVIPTYLYGTLSIWPPTQKMPKLWGKTACVFGTPIRYEQFAHLEKKEAQKALAEALTDAINGLKKWYDDGAKGIPP